MFGVIGMERRAFVACGSCRVRLEESARGGSPTLQGTMRKRGQSYEIMFCCSAPFSPFLLSSMNFAFFLQGVEWGGRIFRFVIVAPVGRGAVDPMAGPIGTGYRKSKSSVVCHPCGFVFIRG